MSFFSSSFLDMHADGKQSDMDKTMVNEPYIRVIGEFPSDIRLTMASSRRDTHNSRHAINIRCFAFSCLATKFPV